MLVVKYVTTLNCITENVCPAAKDLTSIFGQPMILERLVFCLKLWKQPILLVCCYRKRATSVLWHYFWELAASLLLIVPFELVLPWTSCFQCMWWTRIIRYRIEDHGSKQGDSYQVIFPGPYGCCAPFPALPQFDPM
jgi:hypothetical protein